MNSAIEKGRQAGRGGYSISLVSIAASLFGIVLFLGPLLAALPEGPIEQAGYSLMWPILFTALIALGDVLLGIHMLRRPDGDRQSAAPAHAALFAAAGLALVSILWQWIAYHQIVNLYTMARSWSYLAGLVGLAWGIWHLRDNRAALYGLVLCLVAGAGVCSGIGAQDYLGKLKSHVADWREFATSSPDFLAGFLVMTLPVTLALWLGAPASAGKRIGLLYGLAFFLQLFVLPATGSRFALFSIVVGFVVFALAALSARRRGMPSAPAAKFRIGILVVLLLAGSAVFARPIVHRLQAGTLRTQAHSADFRIWTWKGAARLAVAHPVLGTGPGTFVTSYPRHALVGFTRLAHDSYLQIADDIGIPALLLIVAGLLIALSGATRALTVRSPEEKPADSAINTKKKRRHEPSHTQPNSAAITEAFLGQVAFTDDRLLLSGLIAGLAAGLVQNVIDSDIFVFSDGVTLFMIAGLMVAIAGQRAPMRMIRLPRPALMLGMAVYGAIFFAMLLAGAAAGYAAKGDYQTAEGLSLGTNADYLSELAWQINAQQGQLPEAEQALILSASMAPNGPVYSRLGMVYSADGKQPQALAAFKQGLGWDPNSPALLLDAAQASERLGQSANALALYKKMADLQQGPYGQVLAITEITEFRYAFADAALGDQARAQGNLLAAASYYQRAQTVLDAYRRQTGLRNLLRQQENVAGGSAGTDQSLSQLGRDVQESLSQVDRAIAQGHASK